MTKKIIFGMIVALIFLASAVNNNNNYILLEFSYDNNNFSLTEKTIENGYPSNLPDYDNRFNFSAYNTEESEIFSNSFDPSRLYFDSSDQDLEGGIYSLNETTFYIALPNFYDINKIKILEGNTTLFEEEIYDVGAKKCRVK